MDVSLPRRGVVKLTVHDAAGRIVATLRDEVMDAGTHTVAFDAATLPNGLYFISLRTAIGTATRKLTLLR